MPWGVLDCVIDFMDSDYRARSSHQESPSVVIESENDTYYLVSALPFAERYNHIAPLIYYKANKRTGEIQHIISFQPAENISSVNAYVCVKFYAVYKRYPEWFDTVS